MIASCEKGTALRTRLITTDGDLAGLRGAWEELGRRSADQTVFSTWEWTTAVWKHFGGGCRMFVIVVEEEGGEVVGIAPLVIDRRLAPLRVVRFMASGFIGLSISDYCGFLMAEGREEEVVSRVARELLAHSDKWDVIDLQEVREDSKLLMHWPAEADRQGLYLGTEIAGASHIIALPDTWPGYLSQLSSNARSSLERKMRKFAREHDVRFEPLEDPGRLHDMMNVLIDLHTERWGGDGQGMFRSERRRQFYTDVAVRALRRGWLDLTVMSAGHVAVGALFNFKYGNTRYYYNSGCRLTREWSGYSPGKILLGHSIEQSIREGASYFDMLRGHQDYKSRFGAEARQSYRLLASRNQTAQMAYSAARRLRSNAPAILSHVKRLAMDRIGASV